MSSKFGSGNNVDGSRVIKWLGVIASKSVLSLLNGQRGREFNVALIWVSSVIPLLSSVVCLLIEESVILLTSHMSPTNHQNVKMMVG